MSVAQLRSKTFQQHENEQSAADAAKAEDRTHPGSSSRPSDAVTKASMATPTTATTTTKTKAVVKSAITKTAASSAATAKQQKSCLPQASLLKIEAFVPSFNTHPRPPTICRSQSTLSSTQLKHSLSYLSTQNAPVAVRRHHFVLGSAGDGSTQKPSHPSAHPRRRANRYALSRQRSKSNSSSASVQPQHMSRIGSSPTGGATASADLVTHQSNGVCRVVRSPQEREKLPDRINYDRRGLTAIPIFEQETNLRLLSLQHNLINVLQIPGQQSEGDSTEELTKAPANHRSSSHPTTERAKSSRGRLQVNNLKSGVNLLQQLPPSKNPSSVSSSFLQRSLLQPGVTKQQLLQQRKYSLQKSKSFASNYLQQLHGERPSNQQPSQVSEKALSSYKLQTLSAANVRSFDSGVGTSILTTTTDSNSTLSDEQLTVTNQQLLVTYGAIFRHLVFLDLYNNQIERIANLDGLPALSVLLLGKNRITELSGLRSVGSTLRVLDLHGNRIVSVSHKLNSLQQLQSLNLAGNHIRQIGQSDFKGLNNLKELNLKRNRLRRIGGFQHLAALERLWLCHNDLHKVEDMATIAKAVKLQHVTIEDNPVSLAGDCASFLVSYLPRLQSLSQMPITEQVRSAAAAWRQTQERSEANRSKLSSEAFNCMRREQVISNARTNWELLRSQQNIHDSAKKRGAKVRELTRIKETRESVADFEELEVFMKLPPIQRPQQEANECPEQRSRSPNSSLSPNVDSCSCYSSAEDESNSLKMNTDVCAVKGLRDKQRKVLLNEGKTSADRNKHLQATTTVPDESQVGANQPSAVTTSSLAAQSELQRGDVLVTGSDGGASKRSISSACVTKLPQADKRRGRRTADDSPSTVTVTEVRDTASSTLTTGGSGRSSSLGCHVPSNNSTEPTNCGSATPQTFVTPRANLRRYMQGSLMRSHTVVGGRGPAKSNLSSKVNGNQNQQRQRQRPHQQNSDRGRSVFPSPIVGAATITMPTAEVAAVPASSSGATQPIDGDSNAAKHPADREQGGDYLIEICGQYLNVYGQGALRYVDKQWNPAKANDVHTLKFSYIHFNNIAPILGRIKARFPCAENFVFRETNICCLGQLNALAELLGIASLFIDPEGNSITTKDLWRLYAVYRLSHWGLKLLNGCLVSEAEVEQADNMYAGLSDLVLWAMPDTMLQPLLARLRLDETCNASKLTPKEWLMQGEKALRVVVGKEALQWKKPTNDGVDGGESSSLALSTSAMRERGKQHLAEMMLNTCNAAEKLQKLETVWPTVLLDIVRNTLVDYTQMDVYLCNLMMEIMKQQ